jgi:hypothetical protein
MPEKRGMMETAKAGATLALRSQNTKTGLCAVTYASIAATCPKSCALKGEGCYAQGGRVAIVVHRLDAQAGNALATARAEAALIRENAKRAPDGYPLRLHASGDCRTETTARTVSNACAEWPGPVWTYTHAWRDVPRKAWGSVSVLASIESVEDGRAALRAGYAPAVVVHEHPHNGRAWRSNGVTWIPCPEQTRGVTCAKCRLCFDADALKERRHGIAFAAHGNRRETVKRNLRQLPLFKGGR